MFQFAQIEYLYLLLILPLLLALYIYIRHRYRRSMERFAASGIRSQIMPEAAWGKTRDKFILISLAITMLVVALARPQMGAKLREQKRKGVEVIFVVDVSNSMLAEDFKPSRLERTKYAISSLLDRLQDDRIGMVVFAGDAFVQLPVTSDFVAAKSFISHISPDMIQSQGTDLEKALRTAARSFSAQSDKSRVMVVISDGENHEGSSENIADEIAKSGIVIHTIGIGTPEGAPLSIGGEMLKDQEGNMVVTKLDEEALRGIAVATGGSYIRATNRSLGLDEVVAQIRSMEEQEFSAMQFDEYNEQFYYLLAVALLLLVIEGTILERKNRFIARLRIFNKNSK